VDNPITLCESLLVAAAGDRNNEPNAPMKSTTTQFLPIINITTHEGQNYLYGCGAWGTKEQAEQSLETEQNECEGKVNYSYFEIREVEIENGNIAKLSKSQSLMMMLIGSCPEDKFEQNEWNNSKMVRNHKDSRVVLLRGSHQHRTAYSLVSKGFVQVFCSQEIGWYAIGA